MTILAIRFSSLGDVLLTLPAVARLRAGLPGATVRFLTREPYASLLEFSPLVDVVERYSEKEGLAGLARRLRADPPDVVLDCHSSLRSRALTLALRRPVWRAPGNHRRRRRLLRGQVGEPLDPVWQVHQATADRLIDALDRARERAGKRDGDAVRGVLAVPLLQASPAARQRCAARLPAGRRSVVLAPGARWANKRWPLESFAALAAGLLDRSVAPVVIGAPEERSLIDAIAGAATGAITCTDGWDEMLAWIERSDATVGNDSGLTHLSETLGTPVVALFGPTTPRFGFAPRLEPSIVLERALPCRPCSLHGGERCPLGHHACLRDLPAESVIEAVLRLLEVR